MALLQKLTSTSLKQDLRELGVYIDGIPARKALAVVGDMCLVDSDGTEIDMTESSPSAGGGNCMYSNAQGDFVATPTNGAATITITGLPFTLEAIHVAAGYIIKIAVTTDLKTVLAPTSISVAGGVITLGGIANFATGDEVLVVLVGPDKSYDIELDNQLVNVQNPNYAHTTNVETIIDEDDCTGSNATADAGGGAATIVDADGAFTVADGGAAVGYTAHNITESTSALIISVDSTTNITTGAGATDWSSDEYYLPLVKRYELDMDTYNFFTLQYRLTTVANVTCYLKIYGTLDDTATVDDDTYWEDMSAEILSGLSGYSAPDLAITCTGALTVNDIVVLDLPTTMLKYMFKLVVEKSTTGASVGCLYNVLVKKSS